MYRGKNKMQLAGLQTSQLIGMSDNQLSPMAPSVLSMAANYTPINPDYNKILQDSEDVAGQNWLIPRLNKHFARRDAGLSTNPFKSYGNEGTDANPMDRGPVDTGPEKSPEKPKYNPFLLLRGVSSAASLISNMVARGRQNNYDYMQQTALGQLNSMPVDQFQPTYNNMYAQQGGNTKRQNYFDKTGHHYIIPKGKSMDDPENEKRIREKHEKMLKEQGLRPGIDYQQGGNIMTAFWDAINKNAEVKIPADLVKTRFPWRAEELYLDDFERMKKHGDSKMYSVAATRRDIANDYLKDFKDTAMYEQWMGYSKNADIAKREVEAQKNKVNIQMYLATPPQTSKKPLKKGGLTQKQYMLERGLKDGHDEGDFDNITPNKARQILHDKEVNGKPLTADQYRLFGYLSKGHTTKYEMGGNPFSTYAKYGGNLKNIIKDYNKFSNEAQMDMGDGKLDDKGLMEKGGYNLPNEYGHTYAKKLLFMGRMCRHNYSGKKSY